MVNSREELEEILPESSTELVSLNTRVPRYMDKLINHSVGIIQTSSRYQKISKQTAVQILIERGYQSICEDFRRMDSEIDETSEETVNISPAIKPQNPHSYTFNINSYYEMSNKSPYSSRRQPEPQLSGEKSESAERIQSKLGLK